MNNQRFRKREIIELNGPSIHLYHSYVKKKTWVNHILTSQLQVPRPPDPQAPEKIPASSAQRVPTPIGWGVVRNLTALQREAGDGHFLKNRRATRQNMDSKILLK